MVVTSLRGGTEPGLQTELQKSIGKGTISEKRSFFCYPTCLKVILSGAACGEVEGSLGGTEILRLHFALLRFAQDDRILAYFI
jgi:hypothetical protein